MSDYTATAVDFLRERYPDALRKPSPHEVGEAMIRAIADGELERRDLPLNHYFAEGLYGRRIYCKAGDTIVTQRHKTQHITIALKGVCYIYAGEHAKRVEAPEMWITEPGTQRVVFCETDVEWVTVHHNPENITDLDIVEAVMVDDTLTEYRKLLEVSA